MALRSAFNKTKEVMCKLFTHHPYIMLLILYVVFPGLLKKLTNYRIAVICIYVIIVFYICILKYYILKNLKIIFQVFKIL